MSTTRTRDPRYADQLGKDAGWAMKHEWKRQKTGAAFMNVDQPTMSRMVHGKQPSAVSRFLEHIHDAVLDPKADPGALIAMAMLTAERAACDLDMPDLLNRIGQATVQETMWEAQEDIAEFALVRAIESNDRKRIADACMDYNEQSIPEIGAQLMVLTYVRAILCKLGLRVAPEGV